MVRRVKERIDIVDLVGDYVPLKKAGSNYKGLCPFHGEKTPSFSVSQERQTFHCFGCGKGGDVFSFLMELEGLSFPEALEQLAARAGVEIPRRMADPRERTLGDVLEMAASFYGETLRGDGGRIGRQYLERRKLVPEAWATFQLGWAPSSWDSLSHRLSRGGVPDKVILDSGLAIEGRRGLYDRFRGRVIFPIRDITGRLIAFGGRLVDGEGAKYLNSPENDLYSKRRSLYLVNRAKRAIREKGRSILVEGYMDAIRLHLCGFEESVASLGTALTEDQAQILKRLSSCCFICYDSDAAGQEATLRGMYILQETGLDVHVVVLPKGKDPDELLSSEGGTEIFQKALESARPLLRHHLDIRREALGDMERRRSALVDILGGLSRLPDLEIAPFLPELAQILGVSVAQVIEAVREERNNTKVRDSSQRRPEKEVKRSPARVLIDEGEEQEVSCPEEEALCFVLWEDSRRRAMTEAGELLQLVEGESCRSVLVALLSGDTPQDLMARWHELGDSSSAAVIARGGDYCERLPGDIDRWDIILGILRHRNIRREYDRIGQKLRRNEATSDELRRYHELGRSLKGGHSS